MGRARDRGEVLTFEQLRDAWLTTLATANTRAAYGIDLASFGRWCVAEQQLPLRCDAAVMAAFQAAQRAQGRSEASQRRQWSAVSSFFRYAVAEGAIDDDPTAAGHGLPYVAGATSPTGTLSAETVAAYLTVAEALDARLDALVSLIVFDGLKLGEALALDVDDVRGRPPNVTVRLRRRGVETRLRLQPRSARAVHRCAGRRTDEPLFTGPRRGGSTHRLTRFGADHLLKKLAADGDAVTSNALRRFHVTSARDAGVDIETVRVRAGVDDRRTVRRYLRPDQTRGGSPRQTP